MTADHRHRELPMDPDPLTVLPDDEEPRMTRSTAGFTVGVKLMSSR